MSSVRPHPHSRTPPLAPLLTRGCMQGFKGIVVSNAVVTTFAPSAVPSTAPSAAPTTATATAAAAAAASGGLSTGAIIGIAVGGFVALVVCACIAFYLVRGSSGSGNTQTAPSG